MVDPLEHLTCYDIDPKIDVDLPVSTNDQLDQSDLLIRTNELLCVPSIKLPEPGSLLQLASGASLLAFLAGRRGFQVGNGAKRPGKRLLTVGTDCSVGKMYTSLAIEREFRARGVAADFRATGQTGIFIAGDGVSVDAVVADFISGAAEWLTPANDPDHWDVVEGQGSLHHASYAGVSLGLLHGSQPDALVLCHEPTRPHMRGLPDRPLPSLTASVEANLAAARLTNPDVRLVGASLNTSALDEADARRALADAASELGVPAVDPVRDGVAAIVDGLI